MLVNYAGAEVCVRCEGELVEITSIRTAASPKRPRILSRIIICTGVCLSVLLGFYVSLIGSAKSLTIEQKSQVRSAIRVVREKGFLTEAMLLDNFTVYRGDDNWLNASVAKENAFAATNFPFEIMTLYSDFFAYPADDTERAAILLHEARHLKGEDEKEAYRFVWTHRKELGWTKGKYFASPVWENVRHQTKENVPELFVCGQENLGDCTE